MNQRSSASGGTITSEPLTLFPKLPQIIRAESIIVDCKWGMTSRANPDIYGLDFTVTNAREVSLLRAPPLISDSIDSCTRITWKHTSTKHFHVTNQYVFPCFTHCASAGFRVFSLLLLWQWPPGGAAVEFLRPEKPVNVSVVGQKSNSVDQLQLYLVETLVFLAISKSFILLYSRHKWRLEWNSSNIFSSSSICCLL